MSDPLPLRWLRVCGPSCHCSQGVSVAHYSVAVCVWPTTHPALWPVWVVLYLVAALDRLHQPRHQLLCHGNQVLVISIGLWVWVGVGGGGRVRAGMGDSAMVPLCLCVCGVIAGVSTDGWVGGCAHLSVCCECWPTEARATAKTCARRHTQRHRPFMPPSHGAGPTSPPKHTHTHTRTARQAPPPQPPAPSRSTAHCNCQPSSPAFGKQSNKKEGLSLVKGFSPPGRTRRS